MAAVTQMEGVPHLAMVGPRKGRRYTATAMDWSHLAYIVPMTKEKPQGSNGLTSMARGCKGGRRSPHLTIQMMAWMGHYR